MIEEKLLDALRQVAYIGTQDSYDYAATGDDDEFYGFCNHCGPMERPELPPYDPELTLDELHEQRLAWRRRPQGFPAHKPDCPVTIISDFVRAYDAMLADEAGIAVEADPAPPPKDLAAHKYARHAMHFIGWIAEAKEATIKNGDDELNWEDTIAEYGRAMGASEPLNTDYSYLISEFEDGKYARPLAEATP